MLTVNETVNFQQDAKAIWTDAERMAFIDYIAANPLAGDVCPGTDGLRKVRAARAGMGRRGGARVIYFNRLESGVIHLLAVYPKSTTDNLSAAFLLKLKGRLTPP